MTFRHIVKNNLKHNLNQFTSYIFVNIFVVAILFMYGSIIFNEKITTDPLIEPVLDFVFMGVIAIVLFSIVFVSYTGIYFIKSRSKELGILLTLGMTKRDLLKMLYLESFVIMLVSVVAGMFVGVLFSKFFYAIFSSILNATDLFYLDYKSFVLSAAVFLSVFLFNLVFTTVFIKRTSILKIIKSDQTKGIEKERKVLGFIGTLLFIGSIIGLWLILSDSDLISIPDGWTGTVMLVLTAVMFISMYFTIAFGIDIVIFFASKKKSFYNKNLLFFSNLRHRFFTYKTTLYVVSLLVMMSIFFMGFGFSFYKYSEKTFEQYFPYDFMIESDGSTNVISEDEITKIVEENGGEISAFSTLYYLPNEIYRYYEDGGFENYRITTMVVSEENFNAHTDLDISVESDELLIVSNEDADFEGKEIDYDTVLTIEDPETGRMRADQFRLNKADKETFIASVESEGVAYLEYEKENTTTMYLPFINCYGNVDFAPVQAYVIDDAVYETLTGTTEWCAQMFNLSEGDEEVIYQALLAELRVMNGSDETVWSAPSYQEGPKTDIEQFRPICKAEVQELNANMTGVMMFTMAFLSMLFLIASSVVLYYKLVNDTDYEKQQVELLKTIGVSKKETNSFLNGHIRVIFFTPLVVGGALGIMILYWFFQFSSLRYYLLGNVLVMYGIFVLFNILMYFVLRRTFMKKVYEAK